MKSGNSNHRSFFAWCRRYITFSFLVITAIVVYLMFFADNSVTNSYDLDREIDRLKAEIQHRQDSLAYYESLMRSLSHDPIATERIVREQYHMQRPGEDVYIDE